SAISFAPWISRSMAASVAATFTRSNAASASFRPFLEVIVNGLRFRFSEPSFAVTVGNGRDAKRRDLAGDAVGDGFTLLVIEGGEQQHGALQVGRDRIEVGRRTADIV